MDAKPPYSVVGRPRPDAVAALFESVHRFLAETQFDVECNVEINSYHYISLPSMQEKPNDPMVGFARRLSRTKLRDRRERPVNMG